VDLRSVLTKPVTPSTLLEAIGDALGKGGRRRDPRPVRSEVDAEVLAKLAGSRVLLVEDNDLNQELASDCCDKRAWKRWSPTTARRRSTSWRATARFDGVLMDCQMPVMDGYAATRELSGIRRSPPFRSSP
jgi:PleD family two-component response regulator